MAVTNVVGSDNVAGVLQALALSTSYLGSSDWVVIQSAERFDFWLDDNEKVMTFKVSYDNGTTFSGECELSAGNVFQLGIRKGQTCVLDVKIDAGNANLGGQAYGVQ